MSTLFDILSTLSDANSFEMLQKIIEHKGLRPEDYHTRKRFYSRTAKLKEFNLIKKVGTGKYKATTLGRVMYDVLEVAHVACCLSWRLKAIDEMDLDMPQKEREDIIRMLVPDEDIQKILLSYGTGYPPKYSST